MSTDPATHQASRIRSFLSRGVAAGFWLSIAATIGMALVFALRPRSTEFDLGSAPDIEHIGGLVNGADFGRPIPDNCALRQKGKDLERVSTAAEVGEREGLYFLDAERGIVLWSSLHDARVRPALFAYSLVVNPEGQPPLKRRAATLMIPVACVLLFGTLRGVLSKRSPTRPEIRTRERIFLTASCAVCLLAGLVPGWNNLISAPDSNSYLTHSEMRTPLVPYWLDAFQVFDGGEDHSIATFDDFGVVNHWGGSDRLIPGVRAWKLVLVLGISLLVWELSAVTSWWLLGGIVAAASTLDVMLGHWSRGLIGYLDVILSEGLSHALTFVCLALVAGYLRQPGWKRGMLVAVSVNLLLLARPGNV
ncbi:MAG: hypothetical protein AB7O26_10985, partial [Planctomycetaceae bacterium]